MVMTNDIPARYCEKNGEHDPHAWKKNRRSHMCPGVHKHRLKLTGRSKKCYKFYCEACGWHFLYRVDGIRRLLLVRGTKWNRRYITNRGMTAWRNN